MFLRKFLILIIAVLMARVLVIVNNIHMESNNSSYVVSESLIPSQEGNFSGKGRGFVGDIEVEVHFVRDNPREAPHISKILVVHSDEIYIYWRKVLDELLPKIITKQSIDVDSISGATGSSRGFIEAVSEAMSKAYYEK